MKQIILGTAGHIDHGKTSLIKALTGVNTDRLKEEKLRGITIELGFASIDLPRGQHIGIVDVPGHEKFVKNMVAGATGIDIVAMVIAADEGVMPQTREHMDICSLLGIKYGLVVLTKVDLVDEEWLELVKEDIMEFTADTFLEEAPVIAFSALTKQGIEDFINTLEKLSADIPARVSSGLFRLPVDRVFTMKGFGTVITGTLVTGTVQVGDRVQLYPKETTAKVRGIQVHNQSVNQAGAGLRTAINFQGLDRDLVKRGDVLARAETLKTSYMVDVSVEYLAGNKKTLKNRTRMRLHTGTSEVVGNLILLDREELLSGETCACQLRLDAPVALVRDDRFVLRNYSPVYTIGGGQVLNPIPVKHKMNRPEVIKSLEILAGRDKDKIIDLHLLEAGDKGLSFTDLSIMTNMAEKKLQAAMQNLLSKKKALLINRDARVYIHHICFKNLQKAILNNLTSYHDNHPLKSGMPKEELKSRLHSSLDPRLFNMLMTQTVKQSAIIIEGDLVRLADHKVALKIDQEEIKKKVIGIYLQGKLMPPYFKEVSKMIAIDPAQAREVLMHLVNQGLIIKVKEDLYFHQEPIEQLKKQLENYIEKNHEITTPEFKKMTGASRKYVIPLLEYFDAVNFTIRVGDSRKLRKKQ